MPTHYGITLPSSSGIYAIRNLINGKMYIGSASNLSNRQRTHYKELCANKHCNRKLQNAWNKYGKDAFSFEILEHIKCIKNLLEREQYHMDLLCPQYNIRKIAKSNLGLTFGQSTREKQSKAKKGIKFSEEHKRNISKSNMGRPAPKITPQGLERQREHGKRAIYRLLTEEVKKKCVIGIKRRANEIRKQAKLKTSKTCTACKIEKNINRFGIRNDKLDGHNQRCLDCMILVREKVKAKNKAKRKEANRRALWVVEQRNAALTRTSKPCSRCHTEKSLDCFNTQNERLDKRTSQCSVCIKEVRDAKKEETNRKANEKHKLSRINKPVKTKKSLKGVPRPDAAKAKMKVSQQRRIALETPEQKAKRARGLAKGHETRRKQRLEAKQAKLLKHLTPNVSPEDIDPSQYVLKSLWDNDVAS